MNLSRSLLRYINDEAVYCDFASQSRPLFRVSDRLVAGSLLAGGVEEPVNAQRGPEFSFVTLMHFSARDGVGKG